jgi:hypothetical protein
MTGVRVAPPEGKPYVTDVGTFMRLRVIADDRASAIKAAKRRTSETHQVVDIVGATAQSADEWVVEFQVATR